MNLIDGKKVAEEIQQELKASISMIQGRKPCLAVVMLGKHPPSQIYVKRKIQACANVGIISSRRQLSDTTTEKELLQEIEQLNLDPNVDGILVQLPLPLHINVGKVMQKISPEKDVDGFHPINIGKLLSGETDGFFSCTPLAVKTLFERYDIEVSGKHVVVFGRSNIVGKPMAAMLMQSMPGGNATVTILHRQSTNIKGLCSMGDILIVAVGQPKLITADMVKEGAVVIDVGINKIVDSSVSSGYKIVGDVDFDNVKDKCSFITPVPGGVGPMTIAMLLKNTLKSYMDALLGGGQQ
ncbi:MAG: bifunctional methylenetetrahydrofolate dehydrogenase/methenyltetrahydrofolate cyclohydrolase FolD [Parachlamydiaceae bacterium]|nr:bifunctional methylenetetrahydrofolate dehydrogenase/methenyltetrahydrofolate cyclohydrolase FolD [Parachlamydiaceae bacterium]